MATKILYVHNLFHSTFLQIINYLVDLPTGHSKEDTDEKLK